MELTILLAKVLGVYVIVGSVVSIARQSYFIPVIGKFVEQRMLRLILGMIELIAGLFLVVSHQVWSPLSAAIITVIGWAMVIEGFLYMMMSDDSFKGIIKTFNRPAWYLWGGILGVVLGVYLAGTGFGVF